MLCGVCSNLVPGRFLSLGVCSVCQDQFDKLAHERKIYVHGEPVYAGYTYQELVRELILRAKVKNSAVALGLLIELLKQRLPKKFFDLNTSDCLVIAAPSSLRSRLFGRFDVAQAVALSLFPAAKRLHSLLPGSFIRRKRAGRNHRGKTEAFADPLPLGEKALKLFNRLSPKFIKTIDIRDQITSTQCILVVDDVLTTGFTMGTLFDQLKMLGAQRVEGLVVAAAQEAEAD